MRAVAILALAFFLSGCAQPGGEARVEWHTSQKSCQTQNGSTTCTYGVFKDRLIDHVACGKHATLGWGFVDPVHGSIHLWVADGKSMPRHDGNHSGGSGLLNLTGSSGNWYLHADLNDYNGQFEAWLTC
jgi:hypothetical protein